MDGSGSFGPFAGLTSLTSAVHSSEINLLAAAQLSSKTLGIDPKVYIGTFLQNAADSRLRLPEKVTVKPSEWLRGAIAPDPTTAELEDQVAAPGTGHDFYVDKRAGFNPNQQTDLINFLLALDDNPGSF